MKDVLAEFHERQVLLEDRIQEYEDLIQQYADDLKNEKSRKKLKLAQPVHAPTIVVEVEPIPLECIQRPFHWQAAHPKKPEDVLKMSPVKGLDPSSDGNDAVSAAKLIPSPILAQPFQSTSSPAPNNGKARVDDLPAVFASIEEHVRVTQFTQGDVDAVFSESRADWEKSHLQSILASSSSNDDGSQEKSSAFNALWLALNSQMEVAKPFLALEHVHNGWGRYMNSFFESMQPQETIVTRRKKRDLENAVPLPATADIKVRPPRGVPLLFSPLSQYEDRMLGTLTTNSIFKPVERSDSDLTEARNSYSYDKGAVLHVFFCVCMCVVYVCVYVYCILFNVFIVSHSMLCLVVQLPSEIRMEEDIVLERCHLQSCAAIAELKLRRLYSNSAEVTRGVQEGEMALSRRKAAYLQALSEDAAERQRIDSELQQYGLQFKNGAGSAPTKSRSTSRSRNIVNGAYESSSLPTNIKVAATPTHNFSNRKNDRSSRPQAARPSPNRMGPPEAAVTRSSQSRGNAPMVVVVKEEPVNSRSSSRSRERVIVKAEIETVVEGEKFSMLNGGQVIATGRLGAQSASSNRNRTPSLTLSTAVIPTSGIIEDGLNGALGTSIIVQNKRKSVSK